MILGTGCSQPVADDSSKLKAEIISLRVELDKARAECAAVRTDLEKLKADLRNRPVPVDNRERAASFPGRLAAATALTSPTRRQEALGNLAVEAAELGNAEVTRGCLDQLTSPTRREELTYQCALRLARANKVKEAVELAKSLASPTQREKALSQIAGGRNGD
jgi:hypothetical protein